MKIVTIITVLAIPVLLAGCSKRDTTAEKTSQEPSLGKTIVDGITRRGAVESGRRAKDQINTISKQRTDDLDEVVE